MQLSKQHFFSFLGMLGCIALVYYIKPSIDHGLKVEEFQSVQEKLDQFKHGRQQPLNNNLAFSARLIVAQRKQIDQQQQEIHRLTEQLLALTDTQQSQADQEPDHLDDFQQADEQTAIDDQVALLDATLAAEAIDPEWSQQSSDKIIALFDTEQLQQAELLSASCGATLCRVEAEVQDEMAAEQFFTHFAFLIDWPGSTFAQLQETQDGLQNIVFFVSREGYALPDEAV